MLLVTCQDPIALPFNDMFYVDLRSEQLLQMPICVECIFLNIENFCDGVAMLFCLALLEINLMMFFSVLCKFSHKNQV